MMNDIFVSNEHEIHELLFRFAPEQLASKILLENGVSAISPFYNLSMQRPQILAPGLHSKFTYIDIPPPVESKDKKVPAEKPECTFETPFEIMKVTGKRIVFVAKTPSVPVNCTEYCEEYSYDGGGCLRLVTEDTNIYHR